MVQYIVDKNVVAGSVQFGHSNTLNGKQWVEAFEKALQTGSPEWWEFPGQISRKENLVLIRLDKKFTLVVPKEKAEAYQKKN